MSNEKELRRKKFKEVANHFEKTAKRIKKNLETAKRSKYQGDRTDYLRGKLAAYIHARNTVMSVENQIVQSVREEGEE